MNIDYSAARALVDQERRRPNHVCLIDENGRQWRTRDLVAALRGIAGWLKAQGIEAGDRVALVGHNSWRHLALALACQWIGAAFVPLPVSATQAERSGMIGLVTPALVLDQDTWGSLDAAVDHRPVSFGPRRVGEEIAAVIMTSGSSGAPKAACLSARALWWANRAFRDGFGYAPREETHLVAAPLSHVGGFNGTTCDVLVHGGCVVILPRFSVGGVLEAIANRRVTMMFAVPTMMRALLASKEFTPERVASLRRPLVGGDTLDPELARQACAVGLRPIHVWGLTETGGAVACLDPDVARGRESSVGVAMPGVQLMATAETTTAYRAPKGSSHLWVGGPHLFSGYLDRGTITPPRTRSIDGVTWIDTGDVGRIDEEGYVWIDGRANRMIPTGGELVAPAEIETALRAIAGIHDVAVVGVPDPYWGHRVAAVVAGNNVPTLAQVRERLGTRLAGWKLPRSLVVCEKLPTMPGGKTDYAECTRLAAHCD
ncbi:MAG: class I adenylate-forming enzyme family protein [Actinomycetaceae bacterium]|nr:class I adenylate-forming enzyme family protein [Actinomycetaceae bacterium]